MKILALTKYSYEGPSSRYRFYNYQECFKKQDVQMEIEPLFSKSYFKSIGMMEKLFIVLMSYLKRFLCVSNLIIDKNKYDLLLLEYELFPYVPAWFEYLLKKRGIKYIVDYDDAIFHKYDMHSNVLIKGVVKNKIANVMRYADTVIVCNTYLKAYADKYNENTFRLPTVVLLDKYKKVMKIYQKMDSDFIIGWVGSRTTSRYVLDILPALKRFVQKYKNVRFQLVGFDESLVSKECMKTHHMNIIPWTEDQEIENILGFDIGIMPLHNDPWSRGKCGFKLVQYMSCKKPVIASPVGMNCDLVEEKINGYLAETMDDWFNAFEKLYHDENLRSIMSVNNFEKIKREYNHEKNCQRYVDLLLEVINDRKV